MTVLAAGALPWRRRRSRLQVAMVHRPRYDDWSWAKGKLDPGEEWPVAAAREVFEETGLHVRLGRPLPTSRYSVLDDSGQAEPKEVRYWAAEVVGGAGTLVNEIDEVVWLDVEDASDRLTYDRDREQLRHLVRSDRGGALATWPLVVVRHANAVSRSSWSKADPLRPLDDRGHERAEALIPILGAYGVTRVVTSPSARCLDTVRPYAVAAGLTVKLKPGLSEEGFAEHPDHAPRHLTKLLARGTATVLSGHGPVLPMLLDSLAGIAGPDEPEEVDESQEPHELNELSQSGEPREPRERSAKRMLSDAARNGMGKGEALVVHVVGTRSLARVVDVEVYAS